MYLAVSETKKIFYYRTFHRMLLSTYNRVGYDRLIPSIFEKENKSYIETRKFIFLPDLVHPNP